MKLLVLSDLHCEFAPFTPPLAAVEAADVVVLAGDVNVLTAGVRWAGKAFAGKPVLYVAGNHEFYGGHWTKTLGDLRSAAVAAGIQLLEQDTLELADVRFLGATLWTDFDLWGDRAGGMHVFDRDMEDGYQIRCGDTKERRLKSDDVLARHEETVAWLASELAKPFTGPTVVITHHLPAQASVADRFMEDPLTPCFASNLPDTFFDQADLWIHGHTHDAVDRKLRSCRLVCNPRGYPKRDGSFEGRGFRPDLIVEVEATQDLKSSPSDRVMQDAPVN